MKLLNTKDRSRLLKKFSLQGNNNIGGRIWWIPGDNKAKNNSSCTKHSDRDREITQQILTKYLSWFLGGRASVPGMEAG